MASTPDRRLANTTTGFGSAATVTRFEELRSEDALSPGAMVHGYELIRELGRGGMGVVWAARDVRLGRRVAIKFVLHAERAAAERFLVEARATAQCDHENIVVVHAADEHLGMPYMVLEFLEGQTLREVMQAQPRLPPSRVGELMLPVARALARAHERGIIHRDLKPENVFVTAAGAVKVLDFGIATALGSAADETMVGTLAYMSPEQMGLDTIDHRSDVWAVGVMMFELLAGHHPVDPPTQQALINNAADDAPMPSLGGDALAMIVDACLRKVKHQRIGSAAELADRLAALAPRRRIGADDNPYPGLTAFQERDADRFFGRTREIARMVARVRERPLIGVVGPSGAGKSSLVRAGLLPALASSGDPWIAITLRPGRYPLSALAGLAPGLDPALIAAQPGLLAAGLRERARQAGAHLLVFVDQFEELYTLVGDPAQRRAFTAALAGIADDASTPLRVIVSMRSDFVDRVAEDPRFADELARGMMFLTTPDPAGLREALVEPIEMVGYRFESPAIVDEMLAALQATPGALPLLQFAAARLWDARDRDRRLLTLASYRAIGGISGALATHADEVLAGMDQTARRTAQRIFRSLVTPERTRAIGELAELEQLGDTARRVLDQLIAARLLVVQQRGDTGGSTLEIVHESLIDRWPTLRRWLDADEEDAALLTQLSAAAKQWDQRGRPSGLLWQGEALEETLRWRRQRPRELSDRDRAFVDAATALSRRGARRRRTLSIAAFVVLGAIATGAIVGFLRVRSAEQVAEERQQFAEERTTAAVNALAKQKEAEDARARALGAATAAERAKEAAQSQAAATSASLATTSADLQTSREQLAADNDKLRRAARDDEEARLRAERATTEAVAARKQAEELVREKQAKIRALETEKKTLSTQLK